MVDDISTRFVQFALLISVIDREVKPDTDTAGRTGRWIAPIAANEAIMLF